MRTGLVVRVGPGVRRGGTAPVVMVVPGWLVVWPAVMAVLVVWVVCLSVMAAMVVLGGTRRRLLVMAVLGVSVVIVV